MMTPGQEADQEEKLRPRKAIRRERHAIESRLPPKFRGRSGYRNLVDSVSLRVSVSGVRGKSGLTKMTAQALQERGLSTYAKVTGTNPVSYKDGRKRAIDRDPRNKAILEETVWEVKRFWPMDAIVLENQAITPYTMVSFNEIFARPNYLFITNVRRDHGGDLARNLPGMARAFGLSAPRKTTIICGERNPQLKAIIEKTAKERGCRFIAAAPRERDVPGIESVHILDAMLKDWLGEGLTPLEVKTHRKRLEENFRWRTSALGMPWFHGAEINDIDSTQEVLKHLLRQRRRPVTLIGYTRRDRVDRTASFIPYLQELLADGVASRVVLAGSHADRMARRLRRYGEVWVARDDTAKVPRLMELLTKEARGDAIYTIMNAVPPWPKTVAEALAGDGTAEAVKNAEEPSRTHVRSGGQGAVSPVWDPRPDRGPVPGPSPSPMPSPMPSPPPTAPPIVGP